MGFPLYLHTDLSWEWNEVLKCNGMQVSQLIYVNACICLEIVTVQTNDALKIVLHTSFSLFCVNIDFAYACAYEKNSFLFQSEISHLSTGFCKFQGAFLQYNRTLVV